MHESRLVADLMREAKRIADDAPIARVDLRIGAMAAVSAEGLHRGVVDFAYEHWGSAPYVVVTTDDDPLDAAAQGVSLVGVTTEST